MIARLDPQRLEECVGRDAAARLSARARGGRNSWHGTRYEAFFGAHRIARLARKLLQRGEDAYIEWQGDAFVDDIVVRRDAQYSFKGYQLKNSNSVSWTAGQPSIADDFALQELISKREGYTDVRLRLVCSDADRRARLSTTLPTSIAGYSKAIFFPYREQLLVLLREHQWLAEDFAFLSKHEHYSTVHAEEVAIVMMGAWTAKAPAASVSDVLACARRSSPQLIRSLQSDVDAEAQLLGPVKRILDRLPDFEYSIARGFLRWSAFSGSTSGVLSFDCFSERFAGWQQHILRCAPTSFEDIEGTLT